MNSKKRIFLVSNNSSLLSFRDNLITELLYLGHNVICIYPKGSHSDHNFSHINNFKSVYLNSNSKDTNIFSNLLILIFYFYIVIKYKPHIIFTFTLKPNLYFGFLRFFFRFKLIWTITGLGNGIYGNFKSLIKMLYSFTLSKVSCIFFQNQSIFSFFIQNFNLKSKYKIINGSGINLSIFSRTSLLDKPRDVFKLIYIGRIEVEKGIEFLLKAFKEINDPSISISVYGDYSNQSFFNYLLKNYNFEYKGVAININKLLDNYHCLINPSFHEGTSNVILESICKGLISLGSDIPGINEIILTKEFLFKSRDIESIKSVVSKIHSLFKEDIIKLENFNLINYLHVVKNYNRKNITKEYLSVL